MNNKDKTALVPKLRFPEFRDSEEWGEKKLGEMCERIGDGLHGTPEYVLKSDYYFVNGNNINNGHLEFDNPKYVSEKVALKNDKLLSNNTILISINGTIGNIAYYNNEKIMLAKSIAYLNIKDTQTKFIFHCLQSYYIRSQFLLSLTGSTIKNLGLQSIRNTNIMRPSLKEQQKIADCLSSLDDLISGEDKKLHALKIHKKSLMQNLFTSEGETVPELRFPEFRDSGEWEEKTLVNDYVANIIKKSVSHECLNLDNYISTDNLSPNYGDVKKTDKLPPSGSFSQYKKGDVLVSNIRPYLKKVWVANKYGACSNDVIIFRAQENCNKDFLAHILKNDEFINYVMHGAKGVKMPRGDIALMKNYPTFIPKLNEQKKIADCLSNVDKLITAQANKIENLKLHKKGLMQGLFPSINELGE